MWVLGAFVGALITARAEEPVRVMVVGTFHLTNPNRDLFNMAMDDVFSARRQAEIGAITASLAAFKPTAVAVEWAADQTQKRWKETAGADPRYTGNEVEQIGFRLARAVGTDRVYGVDVDGEFPFEAVDAYAKVHGQSAVIDDAMNMIKQNIAAAQALLDKGTIGAVMAHMNDPALMAHDNDFYMQMLRIGGGDEQPGAALVSAWSARNTAICARVVQNTKPGDRIVVIFGSGHSFLLRQCFSQTPGFELVEANSYLPAE
jgi:hypothetical protein